MKILPINTEVDDYFEKYNIIVFKPLLNLTKIEIKILSMFQRQNWIKRHIPIKDRNKLVFSPAYRREIRETLGIPKGSLYNALSSLREKNILTFDSIRDQYAIMPETHGDIQFKFIIIPSKPEEDVEGRSTEDSQ